ncbi:Cell wall protein rhd3 [Sticta canariensis]|nr:Cell wall protein rhd3 [Sticta canariensis]
MAQVSSTLQQVQAELKSLVTRTASPLFQSCPQDLWQRAQSVLDAGIKHAEQARPPLHPLTVLSAACNHDAGSVWHPSGGNVTVTIAPDADERFQLPAAELESLTTQLSATALAQLHGLARTAAETVLICMNQRSATPARAPPSGASSSICEASSAAIACIPAELRAGACKVPAPGLLLAHLLRRFSELFTEDEDGIPRTWGPKVSIPSVTQKARQAAAQVLALLAANRLDHTPVSAQLLLYQEDYAWIISLARVVTIMSMQSAMRWPMLCHRHMTIDICRLSRPEDLAGLKSRDWRTKGSSMLQDAFASIDRAVSGLTAESRATGEQPGAGATAAFSRAASRKLGDLDLLADDEWPGVPPAAVLLQPDKCRTVWRQFFTDSARSVQQAVAVQDMRKATSSRMPPLWALVALVVLGYNEFIAVLYNPLWLILLVVLCLFGKTVYDELEVDAEMQHGLLPGCLALSHKFVPTLKGVARRSFHAVSEWVKPAMHHALLFAGVSPAGKAEHGTLSFAVTPWLQTCCQAYALNAPVQDPQALRGAAATAVAAASQHSGATQQPTSTGHSLASPTHTAQASTSSFAPTVQEGGDGVRQRPRPRSVQMADLGTS